MVEPEIGLVLTNPGGGFLATHICSKSPGLRKDRHQSYNRLTGDLCPFFLFVYIYNFFFFCKSRYYFHNQKKVDLPIHGSARPPQKHGAAKNGAVAHSSPRSL